MLNRLEFGVVFFFPFSICVNDVIGEFGHLNPKCSLIPPL